MLSALASPTQTSPSQVTVQNEDEVRLEGLRRLYDDWANEIRSQPTNVDRKQTNQSLNAIYSKYGEHANEEDKELTARWTETLNILLTFAGLQSAVITAFLLGAGLDLRPEPLDQTNGILNNILHKLDNTTSLHTETEWAPAHADVRVTAWWYTSLACSLLSAFGALSSKQWVMHYQSRPGWANTKIKQSRLREMRYQGLTTWWFYAIVEMLPTLLQLSVLFFAIGLVDYLHPVSPLLFALILSFLGLGGMFFVLTLLVGIIYPSCPFKSPITDAIFQVKGILDCWLSLLPELLKLSLITIMELIIPNWRTERQESVGLLSTIWMVLTDAKIGLFWKRRISMESHHVGPNSAGASGIICWWLYTGEGGPSKPETRVNAAVQALLGMDANEVMDGFKTVGIFLNWSTAIINRLKPLKALPPRHNAYVQMQDLLCYLIYNSRKASQLTLNVDGDSQLLHNIRKTWCDTKRKSPLPIADMRWATVATCMHLQLREWCSRGLGERPYRDELLLELPVILKLPSLLEQDLSDAVALAAIALVPDDIHGVRSPESLKSHVPLEQLLEGLHRLSYYGHDRDPHILLPLAVQVSRKWVESSSQETRRRCSRWMNGTLRTCLHRLVSLPNEWERASNPLGANVAQDLREEIQAFLSLLS